MGEQHVGLLPPNHGDQFTTQREDAEVAMLCLHLLHLCLVSITTLLLQRMLAKPSWLERLMAEDRRPLTPLIYSNVNPDGVIRLDMSQRLPVDDEELT